MHPQLAGNKRRPRRKQGRATNVARRFRFVNEPTGA